VFGSLWRMQASGMSMDDAVEKTMNDAAGENAVGD
jgi:hypothetical protein